MDAAEAGVERMTGFDDHALDVMPVAIAFWIRNDASGDRGSGCNDQAVHVVLSCRSASARFVSG
jgi:hypothetical protein